MAGEKGRMLQIDGSLGEGGGQLLRTALSLSCILQKPVKITKIRAGRSQPGLKAQHLAVCGMLARICDAEMEGAHLGSVQLEFSPGKISAGSYSSGIGTAGSCTLFLQAALPVLVHAGGKSAIEIRGGTHVRAAPTFDYFSEVFLPAVRKFGLECSAEMLRAGFYPKGGGKVKLECAPSKLRGCEFAWEKGETHCRIISAKLPSHVAEREGKGVEGAVAGAQIERKDADADCAGNAITIWRGSVGASSLGEAGKSAEKVAAEACGVFLAEEKSGAVADAHLADQLLIYAALAEGKTEYKTSAFTPHLKTNAEIISQMTGRNIMLHADDFSIEVI
jgi:RNA 3'-terminal phosphate cyclase (ATP)